MKPRLDLITLAVHDLDAARRFYSEGLGWTPRFDVPGEVVFIQVNSGLLIGLFGTDDLAQDMGVDAGSVVAGQGFTLAQIVEKPEEVHAVLAKAEAAGARTVKPPQWAAFGGYHAYFEDPVGIRWEIGTNPGWHVDADGTVTIGPIDDAQTP